MYRLWKLFLPLLLLLINRVTCERKCEVDEFLCKSGECIYNRNKCDNDFHCVDGSDEGAICDCSTESGDIFVCPSESSEDRMCIFNMQICDGYSDCPDGADEDNCPELVHPNCTTYQCHNRICLRDKEYICDGTDDCGDNSDEFHCDSECTIENDLYSCSDNSSCLLLTMVCDGVRNCNDGSDESHLCAAAPCSDIKCPSDRCVQLATGPKCHCGKNFLLKHDGENGAEYCQDIDECQTMGVCSQICNNLPGSFQCSCWPGFHLHEDNWTCLPNKSISTWIYYSNSSTEIWKFNTDDQSHSLAVDRLRNIQQVVVDSTFIYWREHSAQQPSEIFRKHHNEITIQRLSLIGVNSPQRFAVDFWTGNIYIIDGQAITVCDQDGSKCFPIISEDLKFPRELVVHPSSGKLFWTDLARDPCIGTSFMDGRERKKLVEEDIGRPIGLTVDHPGERLYWIESNGGRVETIRLNGDDRRIILFNDQWSPYNLQVLGDKLYVEDRHHNLSLTSMDKFTGQERSNLFYRKYYYLNIYAYHPLIQRPVSDNRNPCAGHKCSSLCLLAGNNGHTCMDRDLSIGPDNLVGMMAYELNQGIICDWTQFRCVDGSECLEMEQQCDNTVDCKDGSDEMDCDNETTTKVIEDHDEDKMSVLRKHQPVEISSCCGALIAISILIISLGLAVTLHFWFCKQCNSQLRPDLEQNFRNNQPRNEEIPIVVFTAHVA